MKQEMRDNWVKALRSGEYQQGEGKLRTEDGKMCCIGIWCIVNNIPISDDGEVMNNEHTAVFYRTFQNALEIDAPSAYQLSNNLAKHNDGTNAEKWNFNQIADYIEKEIPITE